MTSRISLLPSVACVLSLVGCPRAQEPAPAERQWQSLFNGRDLFGWTPKIVGYPAGENFANTFRVVDGLLTVSYDDYEGAFDGRFGHLFYEREFSNYRLRVEYRFVGEQMQGGPGWAFRNSGLMLHGQSPKTMTKTQDFPASVEVQLLGGDGTNKRTTSLTYLWFSLYIVQRYSTSFSNANEVL